MKLDEFIAYVEANRKASKEQALSALSATIGTTTKEKEQN